MTKTIIQKQFQRVETKYIVNKSVLKDLLHEFDPYLIADDFAKSTITNIYFDNKDFQMIQDSLAKKYGKEKIRMRLYDQTPQSTSQAFLEIKQKFDGVGFKFRLTSNQTAVINYVSKGISDATIVDEKVTTELVKLRQRYGKIMPKMYIYYDRQSFKGREDKQVRVTIDHNLIYRDHEVTRSCSRFGYPLLAEDKVIIEVKVAGEQPTWLTDLLTKYQIEKSSFSKYGQAYLLNQERLAVEKERSHA